MNLSPDLKARVLESTRRQPAATLPEVRRRQRVLLGAGLAFALLAFFMAGGVRADSRPLALALATGIGSFGIAALAIWLLVTRGRSMLGRGCGLLLALALGAPVVFFAWKFGVSAAFDRVEDWPSRPGFRCLGLSLLIGAIPLLVSLRIRAVSDPVRPAVTGATVGVAVGLGTAALVDLWCPVAALPHLLLGHVLPIVLLATAGAGCGARWLAIRALSSRSVDF